MAARISMEEYNRQSAECTKAALNELNRHMAVSTPPITRRRKSRVSDDSEEEEVSEPVNISVSLGNSSALRKRVHAKQNISDVSYLIEMNEKLEMKILKCEAKINKLTATIDSLESEIDEIDRKYHYLKLDYSNKCLEFENLEKKYKLKCDEYIAIKSAFIRCMVIILVMMVVIMMFIW